MWKPYWAALSVDSRERLLLGANSFGLTCAAIALVSALDCLAGLLKRLLAHAVPLIEVMQMGVGILLGVGALGLFLAGTLAALVTLFDVVARRTPGRTSVMLTGIFLALVSTVVVVQVLLPAHWNLPRDSDKMPFDSRVWQTRDSKWAGTPGSSPREQMLGDVVRHVLPGKTRDEILRLRGPTDQSWVGGSGSDLVYRLGATRGFGVDDEWLVIRFDGRERFRGWDHRID